MKRKPRFVRFSFPRAVLAKSRGVVGGGPLFGSTRVARLQARFSPLVKSLLLRLNNSALLKPEIFYLLVS